MFFYINKGTIWSSGFQSEGKRATEAHNPDVEWSFQLKVELVIKMSNKKKELKVFILYKV